MKKRHKAILLIGVGGLIYGIGIKMGFTFLNVSNSPNDDSMIAEVKASYKPSKMPEEITKWLEEINPAAGETE